MMAETTGTNPPVREARPEVARRAVAAPASRSPVPVDAPVVADVPASSAHRAVARAVVVASAKNCSGGPVTVVVNWVHTQAW